MAEDGQGGEAAARKKVAIGVEVEEKVLARPKAEAKVTVVATANRSTTTVIEDPL